MGMHCARMFDGGTTNAAGAEPMERHTAESSGEGGRGVEAAAQGRQLRRLLQHADLPAVAESRKVMRDALRGWGVPGLSDTAELLTSELVTNALQHTDHGAVLTATLSPGIAPRSRRLRVEVRDFVARHPRLRSPGDQVTSGRGLLLVQALADAWGVHPEGTGKVVWFELSIDAA
jgi:anti-sigma regulatory factor (Ser/Thr protein kinase)